MSEGVVAVAGSRAAKGNQGLMAGSNQQGAVALNQFVVFRVGSEEYGVQIDRVQEIRSWQPVTRLPNAPQKVLGIVNLRGVVIPVFDMRSCFGLEPTAPGKSNVVIITAVHDDTIGMLVDTVSDIVDVDAAQIQPAPSLSEAAIEDSISGIVTVDDRMLILLDIEHLFPATQVQAFQAAA